MNNMLTQMFSKSTILVKKYSPELLVGFGVLSFVGTIYSVAKATLKVEAVIDESKETFNTIKEAKNNIAIEMYSEADYKKDIIVAYTQAAFKFTKLYGPSLILGGLSLSCFIGGHKIMKSRNVALMGAFKLAESTFSKYRERVVNSLGKEKDLEFRHGITKETIETEEIDVNGKVKKTKTKDLLMSDYPSQYARFFDESSPHWTKVPEYNFTFLNLQQNYMNEKLKANGHLFLNEVYDALGLQRSKAGSIVGWVLGEGDDYVDFGMYDINKHKARDFVNGYERSILLDFNVDGVIYDLI